ncbi:GTP cyclohydrolase I FolE2 [Pseudooceanicola sp. CBS1P-1]|uniref:GTP cyclohydrolase FolE2 n=1 Tax=Pseudooceanicola albus TaxID=2692189 RepID=A0A6L7G9K3_9RHOB|nr:MULTISPECIES: GTP cyclohydrolase FolE2 [Pseudooceanicola]MBT9386619.1 GTP cyclohydrolase I FolE2 [Pseudooceanicola endophyticus]MXN20735.1 GTP cyclohydrolase I FolE2 [Pseudooceanicola albus]
MNAELPDISLSETASARLPLGWVGMQGIDLPLQVSEPDCPANLHARVDMQVDLPRPEAKGIHMSRLYRLLDAFGADTAVSPGALKGLLHRMLDSHADCGSGNARLRIEFNLLIRRPALVTDGLAGWKSYPVQIDASLIKGRFSCRTEVCVVYSSTCPCSAALSRQVVAEAFREACAGRKEVSPDEIAAWLNIHATAATPHSQRSEARVSVSQDPEREDRLGLVALIDQIEAAVQTPVQTGVKRADEQAFAVLNGRNLMFVEDAARRIACALDGFHAPKVHVRHIESLHPHDAVAWAEPDAAGSLAEGLGGAP